MDAAALARLLVDASRAAMLVDYDGSLAPIVDDPDAALPLPAARGALASVARRLVRVAIVSGRPVAFLREHLDLEGVEYIGQYGLERWDGARVVLDPRVEPYLDALRQIASDGSRDLAGVRVERKGEIALGLHWRETPEREPQIRAWARAAAERTGLELHDGRMVVELRPPIPVDKGTVVEALCAGMDAAAFAGDDRGDLAAFTALDRLVGRGALAHGVKVAVRSLEAPPELLARADLAVEGPTGLVAFLEQVGKL